MTYNEILSAAQSLSETERQSLLQALSVGNQCEATVPESSRLSALLEKQGCCPHCGSNRYYRFGKDHGTQRFKCKDCGRTFTEYTGTWQQKLHKKGLVKAYMQLMSEQKSLDKISAALHINKKTAFDWRHKILRSLKQDEGGSFSGITESDETFFDKSDKGCRHLKRKPRKRGGESNGKGISKDKATVIARIHEAAKYLPLQRLSLCPQCGFASCEIGNKLTEAEQWAKLDLVREIAEEVWGA